MLASCGRGDEELGAYDMNGTRCSKCGVDSSYVRKDGTHRCKKCGNVWMNMEEERAALIREVCEP